MHTVQLSDVKNIVDIALVTFLVYRLLLMIRGTRAAPILSGLSVVVVLYFISSNLGFVTLHWILGNFLSSIILVIIVIFQDEIRRALTKVGIQQFFSNNARKRIGEKTIEDLTIVADRLSQAKTGALIVLQRDVGLDEFVEDAVELDALLNRKLLFSIFLRTSPLHDGAVLIEGERIKAAGCVLPLSFHPDFDPNLGTRHRAALGISERSDSLVIVVSEETGSISLVRDGKITRNLDAGLLRESLYRHLSNTPLPETAEEAA